MVHVGMVSFVFAVRWCMHMNASTPQKMFLMLSLCFSLLEGWVFSGASSLKTIALSVLSSCFAWTSCPSVFFFLLKKIEWVLLHHCGLGLILCFFTELDGFSLCKCTSALDLDCVEGDSCCLFSPATCFVSKNSGLKGRDSMPVVVMAVTRFGVKGY